MNRLESSKAGYQFELDLVSSLNGTLFPENSDVSKAKEEIRLNFNNIVDVEHIGKEVNKKVGDILIKTKDQTISVEIKYVKRGTGTFHNTSMNYFNVRFGLPSYSEFLKSNGYPEKIMEYLKDFNVTYNSECSSPFNQADSKIIRSNKLIYKKIVKVEKKIRESYMELISNHILSDKKKLNQLVFDLMNKVTLNEGNIDYKGIPDKYLVFDKNNNSVQIKDIEEFLNLGNKNYNITVNKSGFTINNKIKVQLGWQNGTGLNNPTIRVFVKS